MDAQIDFRMLAEHMPTLCWIAEADGHIVWYNRRWYEYTGSTAAAMEGWGWQSVHDPATLPEVLVRWRASIETGEPFEMTFPLRDAQGRFKPFLTRVVPARDADGAVTAWYGVNTDVSERVHAEQALRRAEAALRDLNADLEAQVEERTRDLVEAKRDSDAARLRAEAADRAKSDFLASMSHEIRTPLHGVLGYAAMLGETDTLTDRQRLQLQRLTSSGDALLTVVDDILDYSKIEAGRIELEPLPFSPVALIENTLSIVRSLAEGKRLALAAEIEPGLPALLVGDQDRLRQILLNLLNNAIKFTPTGRVILRAGCHPGAESGTSTLALAIDDTGIGIPEDKLHRLFERFSQVDGSIRREFGGTGLGLAISKRLAELMGGTITVASTPGRGSTFRVEVRLGVAETGTVAAADIARRMEGTRPLRILVAEDVEVNQDIIRAVLESADHAVDIVGDGAEAVLAVQSANYDLVLMDVQMPGLDGIDATRQIRELAHAASRLPIIAMTANVLPQQIAQFRGAGMDDHVGKPFKRQELFSVIDRWTEQRRGSDYSPNVSSKA